MLSEFFLPPFGEIVIYPNWKDLDLFANLLVKSLSSYLFVSYSNYFIRFSMNIFQNNILCCFEKDSQRIKTSLRLPFSLSLSCLAVGTADWWAQTRITLQRTASYMRCIGRFGLIPMTFVILVGSSGLEPPTSRLSGARSNHLSYEPMLVFGVSRSSRTVYVTFSLRWWR